MPSINLGNSDSTEASLSTCHFMPCKIVSACERARVSTYFTPTIQRKEAITDRPESSDQKLEIKDNTSAEDNNSNYLYTASFRGRPLQGRIVELPEGYVGSVIEAKSSERPSEGRKVIKTFNSFTYWNWDQVPTDNDTPVQALRWLKLSKAIHQ